MNAPALTPLPETSFGDFMERTAMTRAKRGIAIAIASAFWMSVATYALAAPAATLIITNGNIHTMDAQRTKAEALAVTRGKIVYVGSNAGANAYRGPATRVIDVQGRMVTPGFIDGHNHAYLRSEALYWANFAGPQSLDRYTQVVREFLAARPGVPQVRGVNFSLNFIRNQATAQGRLPKHLLDDMVQRDIPAVMITGGHHELWVNSRALQNAGITRDTPNPPGATIEKDPVTGEPTGILREFGAHKLVIAALPFPDFTVEEYRASLLSFQEDLALARGVTSLVQPTHYPTDTFLQAIQQLDNENRLTVRYDVLQWADETLGTSQIPDLMQRRSQYKGKSFKLDRIKIFGTDNGSNLVWNQQTLNETVNALDKAGFRVYVHVISNAAANNAILDAFEYNLNNGGRRELRHTITHVGGGASLTAPRFAALSVRADGHPVPKAFLDAGVPSSSSSDYPVRDFFVFPRIRSAVIAGATLDRALFSSTVEGARLMAMEHETGTIEVGKAADIIAIDQDLTQMAPEQLNTAKVVMTMYKGDDLYRDDTFMSASYITRLVSRMNEKGEVAAAAVPGLRSILTQILNLENNKDAPGVLSQANSLRAAIDAGLANASINASAGATLTARINALVALWSGTTPVVTFSPAAAATTSSAAAEEHDHAH